MEICCSCPAAGSLDWFLSHKTPSSSGPKALKHLHCLAIVPPLASCLATVIGGQSHGDNACSQAPAILGQQAPWECNKHIKSVNYMY